MAQGTQQDLMQNLMTKVSSQPALKLLNVSIISDYNQFNFKNNKFGVCLKGSPQL